jgi:nucleosome assembly protein 1-like 1
MDKNENVQSTGETPATGATGTSPTALGNPGFLQSIQQRFEAMGGDIGSLLTGSIPPEVVRRVNALRNLQAEHHKIEASFFEEVHALECQYLSKYQPLYEKRVNIVKGTYEPTDAESKCAFDEDENDEEAKKAAEAGEKN